MMVRPEEASDAIPVRTHCLVLVGMLANSRIAGSRLLDSISLL